MGSIVRYRFVSFIENIYGVNVLARYSGSGYDRSFFRGGFFLRFGLTFTRELVDVFRSWIVSIGFERLDSLAVVYKNILKVIVSIVRVDLMGYLCCYALRCCVTWFFGYYLEAYVLRINLL